MDASLETLKALDALAAEPGETRRCINCGGYEDSSIDPTGCTCEGDFRAPWAKRDGDDVLVGTASSAEEYNSAFRVAQYAGWLARLEDKLVTNRRLLAEARADRHIPYSSIDRFEASIKAAERDIVTAQKALEGLTLSVPTADQFDTAVAVLAWLHRNEHTTERMRPLIAEVMGQLLIEKVMLS